MVWLVCGVLGGEGVLGGDGEEGRRVCSFDILTCKGGVTIQVEWIE